MTCITLFTTAGCHLCELAETMLSDMDITIEPIEIGDDDALVETYGTIIPVIKFADNSELNWPFKPQEIAHNIQKINMAMKLLP
jgi:hypothetical protein